MDALPKFVATLVVPLEDMPLIAFWTARTEGDDVSLVLPEYEAAFTTVPPPEIPEICVDNLLYVFVSAFIVGASEVLEFVGAVFAAKSASCTMPIEDVLAGFVAMLLRIRP